MELQEELIPPFSNRRVGGGSPHEIRSPNGSGNDHRLLERVLDDLSSGLMVLDSRNRVTLINLEGKRILSDFGDVERGMSLQDLVGENAAVRLTSGGEGLFSFRNEIELRTGLGEKRVLGFTVDELHGDHGTHEGRIISFRDITHLQDAQREMEKVNRLATLAEIGAAVAHEIRNPLAGIKTLTQSIQEQVDPRDDKHEYLSRIVKQVDRLDELLRSFFTYARPTPPHKRPQTLANLFSDVKALVNNKLTQKRITLREDYEAALPRVRVDANQMQQVFLNLFLNAISAVEEGGEIAVEARRAKPEKRKPGPDEGEGVSGKNRVVVRFSDNGCGVPEGLQGKIFEPFYTTKHDGSGLGLSIVQRILEENGACIELQSEEGKGAVFSLWMEAEEGK